MPSAEAGPFRELRREELGNDRTAPYALRDASTFTRDVTVLDVDGDPATLPVIAYASRRRTVEGVEPDPLAATDALVRFGAEDGRSFDRDALEVLVPEEAWEGGTVGAPHALAAGGEVSLYYAAAGGVGLATSADGRTFVRVGNGRVLAAPVAGWDAGLVPASPAVVATSAGGYRMFYAAGGRIGEARSEDGRVWIRAAAPVLEPDPARGEVALAAPTVVHASSPLGRTIAWLYASAESSDASRHIVAAAREGDEGAFVRAAAPVFGAGTRLLPTEPTVVRFSAFTLLFVTARAGTSSAESTPAVIAAVAPANALLPPPVPP